MQKKLFRILSVFLAVVIVSVCFMQPMAYANQVAIGGGLVLLVAGLLIMCGMTFTSQAQAESVAGHVISVAPPAILQPFIDELAGYIGGADPNGKRPTYKMLVNGFATAVSISSASFIAFKMWFDEYFGVDEEVWNGGSGGSLVFDVPTDFDGTLDSLRNIFDGMGWISSEQKNWHERTYLYRAPLGTEFRYGTWVAQAYQNKYQAVMFYDLSNGNTIDAYNNYQNVFLIAILREGVNSVIVGENYEQSFNNINNISVSYRFEIPLGYFGITQTTVGMLQAAWQEAQAYQGDSISVGITDDIATMIEKPYSEIANADSIDDWNYKDDLDKMREQIEKQMQSLVGKSIYDALLGQSEALQLELDKVRELIAAQGADVIGGVGALDGAMVDAGLALKGIQDLIDAQVQDATKIADLERELEKAKEAVRDLTKSGEIDKPIDPPITATGINWTPLASIKGFAGVFPFCIPFDIISMISSLKAAPEAPIFEIPFEIKSLSIKEKIVVDLSILNPIMPFVRLFILLSFAIALARLSSIVIKW